jgi:asparagine synthase (glutamine-hydrolysing)
VDESGYMKTLARHSGADWHKTYPTAAAFVADIERVVSHQEEPFISTSIYAQWKVMELAKQNGVTVLLDGQGADEALAGYLGYFCDYYSSLLRELRFAEAAGAIAAYYRAHGRLASYFARSFLPNAAESVYRRFLASRCVSDELMALAPAGTEQPLRGDMDFFTSKLYLTLACTSVPQLVRYSDRNSMAFGREVRLPFLDHLLLEFLFAVPRHQIMRGATSKVVLRNAMAGVVPDSVRLRKDKIGFETPEDIWFRGELAAWISDVFASSSFKERGWWNPQHVQLKWLRFKNMTGLPVRDFLWRLVCAEIWARVFHV